MTKYIFYACTGEEQIRYACEYILLNRGVLAWTSTTSLLADSGVIAFSDSAPELWGTFHCGLPIISPLELTTWEFDYIYILSMMAYEEILNDLTLKHGVPVNKIIVEPMRLYNLARIRFVRHIAESSTRRGAVGSVAEGGVYRGNFAKVINAAFPDCKLYLFDTFGGFDERDKKSDRMFDSRLNTHKHLANTSIDIVLGKLPYPDKAVICKGYFPKTAAGIEDRFIFVNLDFDLYAPIKAGLEFFFPRMQPGGVILVHDYFNNNFEARKAVDEFCDANGIFTLPIGDLLSVAIVR